MQGHCASQAALLLRRLEIGNLLSQPTHL